MENNQIIKGRRRPRKNLIETLGKDLDLNDHFKDLAFDITQ